MTSCQNALFLWSHVLVVLNYWDPPLFSTDKNEPHRRYLFSDCMCQMTEKQVFTLVLRNENYLLTDKETEAGNKNKPQIPNDSWAPSRSNKGLCKSKLSNFFCCILTQHCLPDIWSLNFLKSGKIKGKCVFEFSKVSHSCCLLWRGLLLNENPFCTPCGQSAN